MTATVPLAPCRDCGREKPVNRWCTATEECQAHTDAALEATNHYELQPIHRTTAPIVDAHRFENITAESPLMIDSDGAVRRSREQATVVEPGPDVETGTQQDLRDEIRRLRGEAEEQRREAGK